MKPIVQVVRTHWDSWLPCKVLFVGSSHHLGNKRRYVFQPPSYDSGDHKTPSASSIHNTFHVPPPICHKLNCAKPIKYFEKFLSTFGGHCIYQRISFLEKRMDLTQQAKCPLPFSLSLGIDRISY